MRIFKSNIIAVLLYGCETWRMIKRGCKQAGYLSSHMPMMKYELIRKKRESKTSVCKYDAGVGDG